MTTQGGRVLLTGATGFIGGHVARRLSDSGMIVIGVARRARPGPWVDFIEADLSAAGTATWPSVDAVVHCAGLAHDAEAGRSRLEAGNIGTARTAAGAALTSGARCLIMLSSVKAMAETTPAALTEAATCAPSSAYGQSKLRAEEEARAVLAGSAVRLTVLRPNPVYGIGSKGNVQRLLDLSARKVVPLLPAGRGRRTLVSVDDVAEAVHLAVREQSPAGTFILDDGEIYTPRAIQDHIRQRYGGRGLVLPEPVLTAVTGLATIFPTSVRRRFGAPDRALHTAAADAIYIGEAARRILRFRPTTALWDAAWEILQFPKPHLSGRTAFPSLADEH